MNCITLTTNSKLYERAKAVIPTAAQTYSKSAERLGRPIFLREGHGCHVWDVEGKRYIDYMCALGPVILGYNDEDVNAAIRTQLARGISFSCPTEIEVRLAERIRELVPACEMVRFAKNGADATAAAVRLARACTGRNAIGYCGYHGYHDWYQADKGSARGVVCPFELYDALFPVEYGQPWHLQHMLREGDVAAFIVEPTPSNNPVWPEESYLQQIREVCDEHNTLLIFDEVFTGFRLTVGGAHQLFNVTPDLVCFSKGIANGMPLSVVGGRADIMKLLDEGVFFSTTFAGETLSMAAALATLDKMERLNVPKLLNERGERLREGCIALAAKHGLELEVTPYGAHHWLRWKSERQGREFQQRALDAGILIAYPTYHNLMYAVTDELIDETLDKYDGIMGVL